MGLDILHIKPDIKNEINIDYLEINDFVDNPEFLKKYVHLIKDGRIHYSINGYLRKQMNRDFIKDFENEKLYFSINDVKKAKSYLKSREKENQNDLEIDFQKNFIDNFIEGESIFLISW